ncbi:MaoC family dehydratase [Teredinibacter haidensis]|uniref:MaoC family dehydratase n=1 Tax=Teredinibacter haidensis TaxID=2731755 RepID=UPI0009491642|nr:MaoC family dehydratase [Teredinibacter haidensis]
MRIVELIKEKSQMITLQNFTAESIELRLRELKSSFFERLALVSTSNKRPQFSPVQREAKPMVCSSTFVRAYHDDLLKKVGFEIHIGEWFEITQDSINIFAAVTKDSQWIHLDTERARRNSPFRSTVAQGFLIIGMIPALRDYENSVSEADFPVRMVVNCGIEKVRFLYPVKPGSRIRARTILKKIELARKCIEVTEAITVEIEGCTKSACVADIIYRVYLQP